ncbi:MAG: hypothetical protein O3A80_04100 [bacterium]|nr:hypothetical protein [bacterium]
MVSGNLHIEDELQVNTVEDCVRTAREHAEPRERVERTRIIAITQGIAAALTFLFGKNTP